LPELLVPRMWKAKAMRVPMQPRHAAAFKPPFDLFRLRATATGGKVGHPAMPSLPRVISIIMGAAAAPASTP
jgi:hypothetical protein